MRGQRFAVMVAAMVGACGDGTNDLPDARHHDARLDAAVDASPDAPPDAAADARPDAGQIPDADIPDAGQIPDGQISDGQIPDAGAPDGQIPDGEISDAVQIPDGQVPDGQISDAGVPDGQVPDGQISDAVQIPDGGQISDAGVPDAAAPDANLACAIPPFLPTGVSTLAGCEVAAAVDGSRDVARFHNPVNVAVATDGTIYVADFDNDRIRRVTPAGAVSTLTQQPTFHRPFGLAFAPDGTLFAQTDDNSLGQHSSTTGTIWRIELATGAATVVVEDVGRPRGLAVLASGLIVLSDRAHHVVSLLDPATGLFGLLAGAYDQPGFVDASGPDARFDAPSGVEILADGSIAVADFNNHRVRRITLVGNVTTLAGTGVAGAMDGPVATAQLAFPTDVAIDAAGALYIADSENYKVRRLAGGSVSTVVGSGTAGYLDDPDPLAARVFGLEGIDVSPFDGKLYLADGSRGEDTNPHHRVRTAILP